MGKKQHQRDKLWMTCTEWKTLYGGKKNVESNKNRFRRLPYYCCSLKFDQTKNPCCTKEGIVFEYQNILEYIKKHKINPVTGKKLQLKNLIRLTFHKNIEGEYHCPITYKPFNDNSHIVAVPNTGHVYSMEGLTVSNLKADQWFDPLTKDEFTKKELIVIQDPENLDKFNMSTFYHMNQDNDQKDQAGPTIRVQSALAAETLKEVGESIKKKTLPKKEGEAVYKDKINEANYSTGKVSASFTSTIAPVAYINETAVLDDDTVRYSRVTEKGGDPTGTGTGGQSIWGRPFGDEISLKLSHNARGFLSMANLGPGTNTSQFFILLRPAKQLDKKHTIFGKVVGGLKVLDEIEKVESDNKDVPIEPIEILGTEVFVDPFAKVDEQIRLERERLEQEKINPPINESLKPKNKREEELLNAKRLQGSQQFYQAKSNKVGKYLANPAPQADDVQSVQSKKSSSGGFKRPFDVNDDGDENEYKLKQKFRNMSKSRNLSDFVFNL